MVHHHISFNQQNRYLLITIVSIAKHMVFNGFFGRSFLSNSPSSQQSLNRSLGGSGSFASCASLASSMAWSWFRPSNPTTCHGKTPAHPPPNRAPPLVSPHVVKLKIGREQIGNIHISIHDRQIKIRMKITLIQLCSRQKKVHTRVS